MNSPRDSIYHYWGKVQSAIETLADYHPLPYHCLDVAAVGQALLEQHMSLRRTLAGLLRLDHATLTAWAVFFLALHDLGKFAVTFQNLRRDLLQVLQGRNTTKNYNVRHDSLGFLLWEEKLSNVVVQEDWLGLRPASDKERRY